MPCSWVEDRLVALADAELSPGETTYVHEHMEGCEACSELHLALIDATPAPSLIIPPEIQRAMEEAVDAAVARTLDEPAQTRSSSTSWTRWLRRDRDLSNGAMLTYGFLLAACLGWGLSNWFAVQALQNETAAPVQIVRDGTVAPPVDSQLDPSQYRPASWTSEESPEPWR